MSLLDDIAAEPPSQPSAPAAVRPSPVSSGGSILDQIAAEPPSPSVSLAPDREFNTNMDGTAAAMSAGVTGQMLPPGAGAAAVGAAMPPPRPSEPGYIGSSSGSDYGRQAAYEAYQNVTPAGMVGQDTATRQRAWQAEMQRRFPGLDLRYLVPGVGEETRQTGPIPPGAANAMRDMQLAPDQGAYFRHLESLSAPLSDWQQNRGLDRLHNGGFQDTSVLAPDSQPFAGIGRQQEIDEARQAQNHRDRAADQWLQQHADDLDFMEQYKIADAAAAAGDKELNPQLLKDVREMVELRRMHEEGLANAQGIGEELKNVAVQGLSGIGRKAAAAVDVAGDLADSVGGLVGVPAGAGVHETADTMRQYYREAQQNHPIYGKFDKFMASLPETVATTGVMLAAPGVGSAIFGADRALSAHEETLDRLQQAVDAGQISQADAKQAADTMSLVAGGTSLITQRLIGPNTGGRLEQTARAAGQLGAQAGSENLINQATNAAVFGDAIKPEDAIKAALVGGTMGAILHNVLSPPSRPEVPGNTQRVTVTRLDPYAKLEGPAQEDSQTGAPSPKTAEPPKPPSGYSDAEMSDRAEAMGLDPSAAKTMRKMTLMMKAHAMGRDPEVILAAAKWSPQDQANFEAMRALAEKGSPAKEPEPVPTVNRTDATPNAEGVGGDASGAYDGSHDQPATPDSAGRAGQGGAGDLAAPTNPHPVAVAPAPPRTDTAEHGAVLAEQFPRAHSIEPFDGGFIVHHDDPAGESPRAPSYVLYTADPEAEIQSRKNNKLTPDQRFETWWALIQKYTGRRFTDADGQPFTLPTRPEDLTEPQRRMIEQMSPSAVNVGGTIYLSPRAGVKTLRHEIVHNKMTRLRRMDPEGYQRLIAPFKTEGRGDLEAEETGAEALAGHPDLVEPPRPKPVPQNRPPTQGAPNAPVPTRQQQQEESPAAPPAATTPGGAARTEGTAISPAGDDAAANEPLAVRPEVLSTPVPLPPLHEDISPGHVQRAWDIVSAQYPDQAREVKRIEPLPYDSPLRDTASYNPQTKVLRVSADKPLTAAALGHEFVHIDQGMRGQPTSQSEYNTLDEWDKAVEAPARDRGKQFEQHDTAAPRPTDDLSGLPVNPAPETIRAYNPFTGEDVQTQGHLITDPSLRKYGANAIHRSIGEDGWMVAGSSGLSMGGGATPAEAIERFKDQNVPKAKQPTPSPTTVQSGTPPVPATAGAAGSVAPSPQPSPPEEGHPPNPTRYTTIPEKWHGLPLNQTAGTGIFTEKNSPVSTRAGARARFLPEWRAQLARIEPHETALLAAAQAKTKEVFPVTGRGGKGYLAPKSLVEHLRASMPTAAATAPKPKSTPQDLAAKEETRTRQRAGVLDRLRDLYASQPGISFNGLNMDAAAARKKWPDKEVLAWAKQQPEDSEPYLHAYVHQLLDDAPRNKQYELVKPANLVDGAQITVGKDTFTVQHDEEDGKTFVADGITAEVFPHTELPATKVEAPKEPELPGGFFDADKAGVTGAKPGLFGQETFDGATGNQQGSMFHEPVDVARPAGERVRGSDSALDPKNTGEMFGHSEESLTGDIDKDLPELKARREQLISGGMDPSKASDAVMAQHAEQQRQNNFDRLEGREPGKVSEDKGSDPITFARNALAAGNAIRKEGGPGLSNLRDKVELEPLWRKYQQMFGPMPLAEFKHRVVMNDHLIPVREDLISDHNRAAMDASVAHVGKSDYHYLRVTDVAGNPVKGPPGKVSEDKGARSEKRTPAPPQKTESPEPITPAHLKSGLYGPGSFIADVAAPKVGGIVGGLREFIDQVRSAVAPQTRGETAGVVARMLREMGSRRAIADNRALQAMRKASAIFDTMSKEASIEFWDKAERGEKQGDPMLDTIARAIIDFEAKQGQEVRQVAPGKLRTLIADKNYLGRIWKDPTKAGDVLAGILGKRPLEGKKGFLKQRSIDYFVDGINAGLEPATYNPVDMALLKGAEMRRFIELHRTLNEMKDAGLRKYVGVNDKEPEGWQTIDDAAFKVYGPPTVTASESYDKGVREPLLKLAEDLGITHIRKLSLGGGARGKSYEGLNKIETKYGSMDQVIAHELGHQFGNRWNLLARMLKDPEPGITSKAAQSRLRGKLAEQMRAVADLRYEHTPDAPDYYKDYVREGSEKEAAIVQAWVQARDKFRDVAPDLYKRWVRFLNNTPKLKPLLSIEPSMDMGESDYEIPHGGLLLMGKYYVPAEAAQLFRNILSPSLRQKSAPVRAWFAVNNVMNQANLSLSAFHATGSAINAAVSDVALGLQQLFSGHPLKAIAPTARGLSIVGSVAKYLYTGSKMLREWYKPGSTGGDFAELVKAAVAGGARAGQEGAYETNAIAGLRKALRQIQGEEGWRKGNPFATALSKAPWAAIEATSAPIMKGLVPRLKFGAFAELARRNLAELGPDASKDDIRKAMAAAWDSVDNRFGQLVYDNAFWNPMLRDAAMGSVRSVGWNLGDLRELGGAIGDTAKMAKDAATGKLPKFTDRQAFAAGLFTLVAAIGGGIMLAMSGKKPKELKDYYYPQTGELDSQGRPIRLSLPTYMKDVFGMAQHPLDTLKHKAAPLLSAMADIIENKDYHGTQVIDKTKGTAGQIGDAAKHVVQSAAPFSVQQWQKMSDDKVPLGKKLMTAAGFTQAPQSMNDTPAEALAKQLKAGHAEEAGRTQAEADKSNLKRSLADEVRTDAKGGMEKVRQALKVGQINHKDVSDIIRQQTLSGLQYRVLHMDARDALQVWDVADDSERKMLRPEMVKKIAKSDMAPPEKQAAMRKVVGPTTKAAG